MILALSDFNSLDPQIKSFFGIVLGIIYLLAVILIKTSLRTVNGYKLGFFNRCFTVLCNLGIFLICVGGALYLNEQFFPTETVLIHIIIVACFLLVAFVLSGFITHKMHNTAFGSGLGAVFITGFLVSLVVFIGLFVSGMFLTFDPFDGLLEILQI